MEKDDEEREKKKKISLLTRIRDMVFALDKDESGSISIEEIEEGWQEPQLRELMADINLPKGWTPQELMSLLDADGDEELTFEEFMKSFYRLIASDPFQQSCCMHASLNDVKAKQNRANQLMEQNTKELKEQMGNLEQKMDARLANIEVMLARFGNAAVLASRPGSAMSGAGQGGPKPPGSGNTRMNQATTNTLAQGYVAGSQLGQAGLDMSVDSNSGVVAPTGPNPYGRADWQPPRPLSSDPKPYHRRPGSPGKLPSLPAARLIEC